MPRRLQALALLLCVSLASLAALASSPTPTNASDLASVFGFSEAELSANREGRVLPSQRGQLWTSTIIGAAIALGGFALAVGAVRFARGAIRVVGPAMGVIAATALVAIVAVPSIRDLLDSRAAVAEGPLRGIEGVGKGRGQAVLLIRGERILSRVDPFAAGKAVRPGQLLRAYHLRHTRRLLSIEASTAHGQ